MEGQAAPSALFDLINRGARYMAPNALSMLLGENAPPLPNVPAMPGKVPPTDDPRGFGALAELTGIGENFIPGPGPAKLGGGVLAGLMGMGATKMSKAVRPKFTDDKFNVYVVSDPSMPARHGMPPKWSIADDGALEMRVPPGSNPASEPNFHSAFRDQIFQFLDKTTKPKYDHYWRFTDNLDELSLLSKGQLRPSFNYADRMAERGLSVATDPHYAVQPYKYGYGIKGEKIGVGSDGEPLLNLKTAEAVTKLLKKSKIVEEDSRRARESMKHYGWVPEDMSRFIRSKLNVVKD